MRTKKEKSEQKMLPTKYSLLAADLSLRRPGFCLMRINRELENPIDSVRLFSLDNKTAKDKPRGQMLAEIANFLHEILHYADHPVYLVREKSINNCLGRMAHSGAAARSGISEVVGVTDYIAWIDVQKEWDELYPVSIKKQITGSGKAEKEAVAKAVVQYIGEQPFENDDESDAAAVALAWLIAENQIKQIIQEDTANEDTQTNPEALRNRKRRGNRNSRGCPAGDSCCQ